MRIDQVQIYRYRLPLHRPITLRGYRLESRDGFVLKITTDSGDLAWGEVAPLPGFSRESLPDAELQLRELRAGLRGNLIPSGLERLDGGFGNWLGHSRLTPSVSVGVETAVLQLISRAKDRPMRRLLCDNARDSIAVNALLSGAEDDIVEKAARLAAEGFTAFKLKIGRKPQIGRAHV